MLGMASYQRPASRRDSLASFSTAYTGGGGDIFDDDFVPTVELDRQGFEDVQLPTEKAAVARPAFGQRWLSSLSNAQPALKRSQSVLHSRAKSFAAFVPKLNTSATQPIFEEEAQSQQQQKSNKLFGELFNGESAPVRLGIPPSSPIKEETEFVMEYQSSFTERPGGPLKRRSTAQSAATAVSTGSKLSWFTKKSNSSPTTPSANVRDEFVNMNITQALLPYGQSDTISPHAFNDLLLNATNLLQRMQTAYKEKVEYIANMQPEIDAQKEEVEEAVTRSRHLKMQLEDMSRKAKEQEETMKEISMELTKERIRRQELQENAAKSIKLVRRDTSGSYEADNEDTPRRRKRTSGGSASDSGFESDFDPETASTISGSISGSYMHAAAPSIDQRILTSKLSSPAISSRSSSSIVHAGRTKHVGADSAAWATVDVLRNENYDLKRQIDEMQLTLQGCIEFVNSVQV